MNNCDFGRKNRFLVKMLEKAIFGEKLRFWWKKWTSGQLCRKSRFLLKIYDFSRKSRFLVENVEKVIFLSKLSILVELVDFWSKISKKSIFREKFRFRSKKSIFGRKCQRVDFW